MLHDTVRLAQPNRNAKEAAAQKEAVEFVIRPFDQVGRDVSRIEAAGNLFASEAQAE